MNGRPRTRFVVAEPSRARWVQRTEHDFQTVGELRAAEQPGARSYAVLQAPGGAEPQDEDAAAASRRHGDAFARQVAEMINCEAASRVFDRLALVAPEATLDAIRGRLTPTAAAKLVRTLARNLSRTPNHKLGDWLRRLELD